MLLNDTITAQQHSSLELLAHRLNKFGWVAIRAQNYEPNMSSDPSIIADRRANLIRGAVKIIGSLDKKIGRPSRIALVNLCMEDAPWPFSEDELHASIRGLDAVFSD